MELKVIEQTDGRRWVTSLNDGELYELLCTVCAWRALNGDASRLNLKPDPEMIRKVEIITLAIVDRAPKATEDLIAGISDPFLRMVLGELRRLKIYLPDGKEVGA